MSKENYEEKKRKTKKDRDDKEIIRPNEIEGVIEIPDARERRDGPGGN